MQEDSFLEKQEDVIAPHIFSVSAAMIGVCLTVIGILNVISNYSRIKTYADDLTAINAVVFLCSCSLSYFALRTSNKRKRYRLARASDIIFLVGLVLVAFVCVFIVLTLEQSGGGKVIPGG